VPVVMAFVHLAFIVWMIGDFHARPWWVSAILGCIYAVGISWNINGISHNFIHTPYFKAKWMNYAFSLLESITVGFSQTLYHWVHMRHHVGNSDRPDESGETVDWISIYRHGKNGQPENVWSYVLLSFFRDDVTAVYNALKKRKSFNAAWGLFELGVFVALAIAALIYDWRAFLFYVPFYYAGNCLSFLNGYYEHFGGNPDVPMAWGVTSLDKFYNWVWFGNGYHAEHHYRPSTHWTKMKQLQDAIAEEQKAKGVHKISTAHGFGFLDKTNQEIKQKLAA
jgi:fatty acid desaturase